MNHPEKKLNVALFITCLVDLFRPQVGFASVQLLEQANCSVTIPSQTCCGQPAYNNGDQNDARQIAKKVIETFKEFDYVVVPSGSCTGTIKKHYVELFKDDPVLENQARQLADRTHELTAFLTDIVPLKKIDAQCSDTVTYHDSCSALRELKISNQPRQLLNKVSQLKFCELSDSNVCCGFGGTFCVKYGAISNKMVSDKVKNIQACGAKIVTGGDLGCLMNIAGKLQRNGIAVRVFHIAEILANNMTAAIGETI